MKDEAFKGIAKAAKEYFLEAKASRKFDAAYLGKLLHQAREQMEFGLQLY